MRRQTFFFHGFSGGGGHPLAPFARELGLDAKDVVLPDMPGFKKADGLLDTTVLSDPIAYERMVEDRVLPLIKTKKIRIVAYSHGAIPAFLFAARHQDVVEQLVLVCPASSLHPFVSLLPRVMNGTVKLISINRLLGVMRNRFLVDAITLYGRKRYWSHDTLMMRLRTRREESAQYNTNMFYLMQQLNVFQQRCDGITIDNVPTVILRTTDDEVIGRNSVQWFRDHIKQTKLVSTVGGHAIVSVAPEKAAKRLKSLL